MVFVGRVGDRFPGVEKIAVLRAAGIGDLMFAMPAIEALAAAYPDAELTLIGSPAGRALLEGRPGPVDEVIVPPAAAGIMPGREDTVELDAFFEEMQGRGFDLAVQLHGGGRQSNPFLLRLGARHTVGARTPDAVPLERNLPYVYYQSEMMRWLEVAGLAGAPAVTLEARLTVTDSERSAARAHRDVARKRLLTIHPGATDPRRRYPHFGEVAARAATDGWQVLVVGDDSDVEAAEVIVAAAHAASPGSAVSLAGRIPLPELLGVLSISDVMAGTDSGPRHLAMAVGTPTVGLFWVGNVMTAGPLGRERHRIHISWVTECPVCGVDVTQVGWTAERCEHDPSYLAEVDPHEVYADVMELGGA